jgi:hypothetical protein
MLSLFWVLVCVVAQPTNIAVHTAAMLLKKIGLTDFIARNMVVDNKFLTNASEGNSSGDLRAVHNGVEKKAVVLVVSAECPVTELRKDVTGEVDTDYALDLPHQVGADSEASYLAADGSVKRLVKVVSATQSNIGIEPVIGSRDRSVQSLVQANCKLIRDPRLCLINYSVDSGSAVEAHRHERIYACPQLSFFYLDKMLDSLGNLFSDAPAQWTDWNVWSAFVAL